MGFTVSLGASVPLGVMEAVKAVLHSVSFQVRAL
jgi:hypothetical protein